MHTAHMIAAARHAVTHPERSRPVVVEDSWFLLKEAQGAPISPDRLRTLQLTAGTAPAVRARVAAVTGANAAPHVGHQIAPHIARARQAVLRILAKRSAATGGDAA
ncbi:hypothetical protein ATO6_15460 [Oceanicola sp. 22II-s10i]|uniref:hypothetical protein n=1 Tax=Oceanicola sp. 22II-s10i TaxID=1317116 RepID=UPI000B526481|nr:hypothetical protein [Oceanicola sp. 22II-s10i]OWU83825.1 hypothetical protein ATO6_15460 [Oceanicola sp. 22II-s10i]